MTEVKIKPHFANARNWPLVRITKNFIVVRYNDKATGKFRRSDGLQAGDTGLGGISKVLNLAELNKLAEDNGGTYEAARVALDEKRGANND